MTARSGPLGGSGRRWVFCRGPESWSRSLGRRSARVVQRCQLLSVPLPAGSAADPGKQGLLRLAGPSLHRDCHRRGVRMGLLPGAPGSRQLAWLWGTSSAPAVVLLVFPARGHFCSARNHGAVWTAGAYYIGVGSGRVECRARDGAWGGGGSQARRAGGSELEFGFLLGAPRMKPAGLDSDAFRVSSEAVCPRAAPCSSAPAAFLVCDSWEGFVWFLLRKKGGQTFF